MGSRDKIRTFIVDDQSIDRIGLRRLLATTGQYEIVGEADSRTGTIDQIMKTRPGLLTMDVRISGRGGIEVIEQLNLVLPDLRIVVVTAVNEDKMVQSCMAAGAYAYCLKRGWSTELLAAISMIMAEDIVPTEDLLELFPRGTVKFIRIGSTVVKPRLQLESARDLTKKEAIILRLVAKGFSNREIATRVGLSIETVKTHVKAIVRKLGARNRTHAAIIGLKEDLFDWNNDT